MDTTPVGYIQAALGLVSLMIAIVFYMAWKTLGEKPWALRWSMAFTSLAIYWMAHLNAERFPSFETYWLTANAFGFATLTLALRGHCERTNCQYLPNNLWPVSILLFTGVMWTTLVSQNIGLSAAIFPVVGAVSLILASIMIIRHREKTRAAEWASAISMILFGISQIPYAVSIYKQGPEIEAVMEQMFVHPSVLLRPAGLVGMGMFVIFMLASDLYEDMKEIAVRDQLTKLFNRRGFGEQSAVAYSNARRTESTVSVIVADIDHFKSVNDEFGHGIGDEALQHFANLLSENRRAADIVARIGGEEFALVLPGTSIREATKIADELCIKMASSPMVSAGRQIVMTASFGVATISDQDASLTDVVVKADRALYRSKRAGRNRVDLESSQLMRSADGEIEMLGKTVSTATK
ncbi:MAG: GGDEF domain-containing protein [Woeseiaceae bacterium]